MLPDIILSFVYQLNGERTISGMYHILTGKKSSQTLQDAHGYRLEDYFAIFPNLNREYLHKLIDHLADQQLINRENDFAFITKKGTDYLNESGSFPHYFRGMKSHQHVVVFERRLYLLIQTITNLVIHNRHFLPIIEERTAQAWVKSVYSRNRYRIEEFNKELYKELLDLLSQLPAVEADLFTMRLTGGKQIGYTYTQLASELELNEEDVHLHLKNALYFLYECAKNEREKYPMLALCTEGLSDSTLITQSARRTYKFVERGFNLEDIMSRRHLKKSTIEDHIVEAALTIPDFKIKPFLSEADRIAILEKADHLKTKRLKKIHEALEGHYTYFQIRLALAHHHQEQKDGK